MKKDIEVNQVVGNPMVAKATTAPVQVNGAKSEKKSEEGYDYCMVNINSALY